MTIKSVKSTPTHRLPWRTVLRGVPRQHLSASQLNLLRCLELADKVQRLLNGDNSPFEHPNAALHLLAASVECYSRGPVELAAVEGLEDGIPDAEMQNNIFKVASEHWRLPKDVFPDGQPVSDAFHLLWALAALQLCFSFLVKKPESEDYILFSCSLVPKHLDNLNDVQAANELLASIGSDLTVAVLQEIGRMVRAMIIFRNSAPKTLEKVNGAVQEIISLAENRPEGEPPMLRLRAAVSSYSFYAKRFEEFWLLDTHFGRFITCEERNNLVSQLIAASNACVAMLEQTAAEAEASGDNYLLSYATARLARLLGTESMSIVPVPKLKALAAKSAAAFDAVQHWLPPPHRQHLIELKRARQVESADDRASAISGIFNAVTGGAWEVLPSAGSSGSQRQMPLSLKKLH